MKTSEEYKALSIKKFTKAAEKYESDHAGIYEMCKKDYPPILNEIKNEPHFDSLLDAGCGTAPMLSLLCEAYPGKSYTGIDLTPAMIDKAKAKHLPNTTFVVGDCENLPFEADRFDIVINSQSFHHYPNPQQFFTRCIVCSNPADASSSGITQHPRSSCGLSTMWSCPWPI